MRICQAIYASDIDMSSRMKNHAKQLSDLLRHGTASQAELAAGIGMNQSAISRMKDGKQEIRTRQWESILEFYRDRGELPDQATSVTGTPNAALNKSREDERVLRMGFTLRKETRLLGVAQGGEDGVFLDNGTVFGMVETPPDLLNVDSHYAVNVVGESMVPALKPSAVVYVDPRKSPGQGDNVVIQIAPEAEGGEISYWIKEYSHRTDKYVVLKQFNPAKELRISRSRVIHAHPIVWVKAR